MNKQQTRKAAREAQEIDRGGIHLVVFQLPAQQDYSLFHVGTTAALFVGRGLNVHKGIAWAFAQIQNHRTRPYTGPLCGEMRRAIVDYAQEVQEEGAAEC